MPAMGTVNVAVEYQGQKERLPLLVVKGSGPTLLGRNWLRMLTKGHLQVDIDAEPHFCKQRNVPYVLREKVDQELTRLQEEGIIEPVKSADCAVPIVPVLKGNGESVRICGDFEIDLNHSIIIKKSFIF